MLGWILLPFVGDRDHDGDQDLQDVLIVGDRVRSPLCLLLSLSLSPFSETIAECCPTGLKWGDIVY